MKLSQTAGQVRLSKCKDVVTAVLAFQLAYERAMPFYRQGGEYKAVVPIIRYF